MNFEDWYNSAGWMYGTEDDALAVWQSAQSHLAKQINEIIYAAGAPLGSDRYFQIRTICCDAMKKVTE